MPSKIRRLLPYVVFALLIVGYFVVTIELERFNPPADIDQNKCPLGRPNDPINTPRPNSGTVKVIRLTNAGEFVDRCEFTDALDELIWDLPRGRFGPRVKPGATTLPKFTVLYIHVER